MDPLTFRFIERITIILVGGLCIYLGYKLFSIVPHHRNSEGKFTLPWNTTIVLSRVGPGTIFALFGITAISISLLRPMTISSPKGEDIRYTDTKDVFSQDVNNADERRLLRRDFAVLNTIPNLLSKDLDSIDRINVNYGIASVKLSLLEPVWGTKQEGFGDFDKFKDWGLNPMGPPPDSVGDALEIFLYGIHDDNK